MRRFARLLAPTLILVSGPSLRAQDKPVRPTFEADGTVRVPAFDLPPSPFLSPEALEAQKMRAQMRIAMPADTTIAGARASIEAMLASQVAATRERYPVDVTNRVIAGVPIRIVTPRGKTGDRQRLLINLHGGAFSMCADACAMLESIPIAALGGFEVVTINYRMGPEARHPAALEDVEKVYRHLLKSHKSSRIGVYGCSAGGALTAQLGAWLPSRGLPQPGAFGIFGAGGVRFMASDSAYVAGYIDGSFPPPPKAGEASADMTWGYFDTADAKDPILSPALHPDVISEFPPTLLITGTRAMDLSPAVVTNSALIKAKVPSTLIVGEGMGHCYIYQSNLPEARDAQQAIVDFFKARLK